MLARVQQHSHRSLDCFPKLHHPAKSKQTRGTRENIGCHGAPSSETRYKHAARLLGSLLLFCTTSSRPSIVQPISSSRTNNTTTFYARLSALTFFDNNPRQPTLTSEKRVFAMADPPERENRPYLAKYFNPRPLTYSMDSNSDSSEAQLTPSSANEGSEPASFEHSPRAPSSSTSWLPLDTALAKMVAHTADGSHPDTMTEREKTYDRLCSSSSKQVLPRYTKPIVYSDAFLKSLNSSRPKDHERNMRLNFEREIYSRTARQTDDQTNPKELNNDDFDDAGNTRLKEALKKARENPTYHADMEWISQPSQAPLAPTLPNRAHCLSCGVDSMVYGNLGEEEYPFCYRCGNQLIHHGP